MKSENLGLRPEPLGLVLGGLVNNTAGDYFQNESVANAHKISELKI